MSAPTKDWTAKRLTMLAVLTACAAVLNVLENLLPFFSGAVGGKVGLANIVTMFVFLTLSWREALLVGGLRSVLGALLGGNPMAIGYSLCGTLCSVAAMGLFRKVFGGKIGAVGLSILGAVSYNFGQILVAGLVLQSAAVLSYLPALTLLSAFAGLLTGSAASMAAGKMNE